MIMIAGFSGHGNLINIISIPLFYILYIYIRAEIYVYIEMQINMNLIIHTQPTSEPRQFGNYKALCSRLCLFTFLPYQIPECSIRSKSFA